MISLWSCLEGAIGGSYWRELLEGVVGGSCLEEAIGGSCWRELLEGAVWKELLGGSCLEGAVGRSYLEGAAWRELLGGSCLEGAFSKKLVLLKLGCTNLELSSNTVEIRLLLQHSY
jgi:hypothetical protein